MECNIPSAVLDEIALEGLEGITISGNQIILNVIARLPGSPGSFAYVLTVCVLHLLINIINASALWLRLSLRKNFNIALDDAAKKAVWRIVCADDAIEAFSLDEPRRPLVIFNRYDHIDTELESICEPVSLVSTLSNYFNLKIYIYFIG